MECMHVFVDESGDEHLNIDSGASKNYVLAAVLIRDEVLRSVVAAADDVRRRYFQSGEMKSSGIGKNTRRRSKLLQSLSHLDMHVVAFCVPKQRVSSDSGLRFAEVFLKYTAMRLCMHLPRQQEVQVTFDAKGRPKFRREYEKYLTGSFPKDDLFRTLVFHQKDSKKSVPLQVADIYAGSIAKQYERANEEDGAELRRLLTEKATVWEWPRNRDWGRIAVDESSSEFDALLRREASRRAWAFLDSNSESLDDDTRLRCIFLKWLVDHPVTNTDEFMLSDEVLSRMHQCGHELDSQGLRNRVIGPLRDAGLLIASSSKGYRLPLAVRDIRRYVDLCNSQIPPALARVRRAREIIRIATTGGLDILAGEDLHELRGAVEAIAPL